MKHTVNIGIMGDFDPNKTSHPATNNAIAHAARYLSIEANVTWLPTPSLLTEKGQQSLAKFDCVWASSGSPFKSIGGMLQGIRIARRMDKPFIGT
jgi:CTP synthase (UTP-ammonia lyase)